MVVLLTALSLIAGGSVGPEQGLGSLGGAFGVMWADRRGPFAWVWGKFVRIPKLTRRERRMNTITGMCGALGSLLPSPYLGCLLLFELGGNNIFQVRCVALRCVALRCVAL
jgi:H+/Cl- antiporter ClcA